ncbi:MAG: phage portal protein, partial [Clostridiales bacterium]|nr:phage portal protein [Clostridiales bacterium]
VVSGRNERNIINSIMCKIAVDCATIDIHHVRLDLSDRFSEIIKSSLDSCLTVEANIDQTGRALIQDIVMSMLDEGVVAVVPIDIDDNNPLDRSEGAYRILTLRTGKIVEWRPSSIKVRLYNDRNGKKEEIWVPKEMASIIENPFYSIMNSTNSTAKRLSRKLTLLDSVDEKQNSNKMNMIIQLPYSTGTEMKRNLAEERIANLEKQLQESPHGIAYSDQTEKIIQLNRPLDNNLMSEVEYLTNQLYQQLGMTPAILDGTADEKTMNNYFSRTIEPIMNAIVEEMRRKFLSLTARSRGQSIMYFRDPFKLAPISSIAELADKFTRNEIMTANEVRQAIGMKPSQDPRSDELKNANISESKDQEHIDVNGMNLGNEQYPMEDPEYYEEEPYQ